VPKISKKPGLRKPRSKRQTNDDVLSALAKKYKTTPEKLLKAEAKRDAKCMQIVLSMLKKPATTSFPMRVYPSQIQDYIWESAASIVCSADLLCVPLLTVAGAAIGRAGRRVQIKPGRDDSSCLWTVCLASSSAGKTPALNAVANFYTDRQTAAFEAWKKNPDAPVPAMFVSDTTLESMQSDLQHGAMLYVNDELSGWTQSMGQYKGGGGGDRAAWTSFWSGSAARIGRKSGGTYIPKPFVAVTGMMVPESAHVLNFRGNADDGFVHRILISCPPSVPMLANPAGVSERSIRRYKQVMSTLFDCGPNVRIDPLAFKTAFGWINDVLYPDVGGPGPDWLKAKYRKFEQNFWRIAFVLHEVWRACGEESGDAISDDTVERAIEVIDYFREHIDRVQGHLGVQVVTDQLSTIFDRMKAKHGDKCSVRDVIHGSNVKRKEHVLELFASWEKKGLGKVATGERKDQKVFEFK